MTKSELIEAIAARGELTKARAEMVVNCVFDAMTEALQRGEGIEIRGYGSFTVRPLRWAESAHRAARAGASQAFAVLQGRQRVERARQCQSSHAHHRR